MQPIPLQTPLVVLGIVELSKRLGITGNWLLVEALLVGTAYGLLLQFAPTTLTQLTEALLYGLTAAGIYDLTKPLLVAARAITQDAKG